ncbi:hypothetical protein ACWWD9_08255 [Methylovorus sp. SPW-M1]
MGQFAVAAPYLLAGSTGLSVLGALHTGNQQAAQASYQADQARADAQAEKGAAQVQAEKIRKAGRQQMAQARTSLAASGVDVNDGTSTIINQSIAANVEEDALTAILNGSNRANRLNAQADAYDISASNAKTASYIDATSSVLAGGYKIASGWKTAAQTGNASSGISLNLKNDPWGNI